ncbi:hypothetical protein AbraIFM66950_010819 [Aspergillus brasiliensis]|nr:hypothetical protein AbraIFM66950_010819 [Aspergillus brasiliensis]
MSRPSRTQQLLNPKLRPQLSADVPSDSSRTKGLATEILAKREEERGRKREHDEADPLDSLGHTHDLLLAMGTMMQEGAMAEQGPSLPIFLDQERDAIAMRPLMILQSPTPPETEILVPGRVNGRVTETPGEGVESPALKNEAGLDTYHGTVNDETGLEVRAWITAESPERDGLRRQRSSRSVAILLREIIGMLPATRGRMGVAKAARRPRPVREVSVLTASVLH